MTATEISARTAFARRMARDAGALAGRYFRREIDFVEETKGPQDFVSAADHALEALIRERLQRAFPTDAMLGGGGLGPTGS